MQKGRMGNVQCILNCREKGTLYFVRPANCGVTLSRRSGLRETLHLVVVVVVLTTFFCSSLQKEQETTVGQSSDTNKLPYFTQRLAENSSLSPPHCDF
jgi:hypothetical protein